MAELLPVGVIGCGRMGKLHARVYSQMPNVKLVGVYDANLDAATETAEKYGGAAVSIDDLATLAKAVTVAVPTTFHLPVATQLIEAGVACLIEKPLAKDSAECRQIVDLAERRGVTVQVGHIERFNPAVRAMLEMGVRPGFMEVTRVSPMPFRSIDVGVVLDVMIHDIDIVLRLADSPVTDVQAVGVCVLGEAEDVCNARLTFANGCVANLTASRLSLKTDRKLRLFSTDAYVSIDYQKRYGVAITKAGNVSALRDAVAKIRSGEIADLTQLKYADLVHVQELKIDDEEPLRSELDAFVASVTKGTTPVVTARDGLAAVEVAERIVKVMTRGVVD